MLFFWSSSGRLQVDDDFDRCLASSSEDRKRYLIARWNKFPLADEPDGTTLDIAGVKIISKGGRTCACKYFVVLKPVDGKRTPFAWVYDNFRMVEVEFMYFPDINRVTVELEPFEFEDVFRSHYAYYKKRQAVA